MMKKKKNFYTVAEVIKILGIARNTLYNWEAAGKIPKPRRDPMSNYRIFTEKDIKKLKKLRGL